MSSSCSFCNGTRSNPFSKKVPCVFCNATGEANRAADSYMTHHPCGCIFGDRKNCIICQKKCHHDSSMKPKVLVSPMP